MSDATWREGGAALRLTGPFGVSVLVHGAIVAAAVFVASRTAPVVPRPPVYRVNIVAAPPGPRREGVVRPPDAPRPTPPAPQPAAPSAAPPAPAPPKVPTRPVDAPAVPTKGAAPVRTPTRATPTETPAGARAPTAATTKAGGAPARAAEAPRAGGGPRGDRGTDVATVRTDGIEFPYPGYLNNIVRQIALNFQAPEGSLLNADVAFTIRRDGSVADVRVVRGSGDYEFDLEARGAVEAAAPRFGSLPAGFSDDALPVVFSFDPKFIR